LFDVIIIYTYVPFLGLPNTFGEYDETPEMMAAQLKVIYMLLFSFVILSFRLLLYG
jgi:methionine synthase I (cobalamin-dependent)